MTIKVTASEHWCAAFIEHGNKSIVVDAADIPQLMEDLSATLADLQITYGINKILREAGYDYRWM